MDSCEKEFESAGQEARRLAIALKRFTEVQDPVWKEKYQHYLSLRFRPAIIELIRQDDFFRIQKLCQFVSITESALDTFIEEAVRLHRERSEERRVGKESRSGRTPRHFKKKHE